MLQGMRFKTMNNRLIFWFLLVSLVPLVVMTGLTYEQRIRSIRNEAANKLEAVRTQKKIQIEQWLLQIDNQLEFLANFSLEKGFPGSGLPDIQATLRTFVESEKDVKSVTLFETNGNILFSTEYREVGDAAQKAEENFPAEKPQKLQVSKAALTKDGEVELSFSRSIFKGSGNSDSKMLGTISMKVYMDRSIFVPLYNRTGLGSTGEAYITDREGRNISNLLWGNDTPLSRKLSTPAVEKAFTETQGFIRNLDYRGEEVLASYTYIPQTDWALVVKQDLIEVDTPIYSMLHIILIIFSFSVSGASALAILISRSIAKPISEITSVAQKVDQGELTSRNRVNRVDELGILARSINAMADSLLSLIRTQDGITGIVSTAVTHEGTRDFAMGLVKKLVEITESGMGAFYIYSPEKKVFKNLVSTGMDPAMKNDDVSTVTLEKEFGSPLVRKEISFVSVVRENTLFTFKTATGVTVPSEMICIPLIVEKEIRGVLILASVWKYSEEHRNMISLSFNSINTSFSNIISNERTNLIATELSQKNTELRTQSNKLHEQSFELRSQSEKLLEQNIELEYQRKQVVEANRLKSEFLSNMSHELRTPLNSILALSRVLKIQAIQKLTTDEAKYLEVVERNGKQLLALINDILDLSKIEAGKVEVSPDLFPIRKSIEEVAESIIPMIAEKDVDLKLEISDDLPEIESDEEKTDKIIRNLLSNAAKFTNEGIITVRASLDGEFVSIEVEDTGIGISETELPFIFDEFRQVDGTSSRQFEGTGLGLAICKRTTEMLGGRISVKSREGVGSRFNLLLPVKWEGPGKVAKRLRIGKKPVMPYNPNKGKKILIVDDDYKDRTIISECLSKEGFEVLSADSGDKALKMAYLYQPHIITLDLIMPELDGWEVIQKLKENNRTRDIPVVIISVSDEKDTASALGAAAFISKPIEEKTLIRKVSEVLTGDREKLPVASGDSSGKEGDPVKQANPSKTILLVEDNEIVILQVKMALEQEEFLVDSVNSGEKAVRYLEDSIPDGVILDLMMPGMDGFDVLDRIRKNKDTADLPVLVFTAKDLSEEEFKKLSDNNIQQLIHKGDIDKEGLLYMARSVFGQDPSLYRDENGNGVHMDSDTRTPRALIIEDNPDNLFTLKTLMGKDFYYLEAYDGEEGLNIAFKEIPDIILLDISIPKIDGYEVAKKLKEDIRTRHIPIIAVTARAMKGEREKTLDSGCDDYISKPIDQDILEQKLALWLKIKAR